MKICDHCRDMRHNRGDVRELTVTTADADPKRTVGNVLANFTHKLDLCDECSGRFISRLRLLIVPPSVEEAVRPAKGK